MQSYLRAHFLAATLVAYIGILTALPANASYYVTLDQFVVTKNQNDGVNGPVWLNDPFSDNNPPPSSEALYLSGLNSPGYIARGTWSESGGRAIADSTNGPAVTLNGFNGGNFLYDEAVFNTDAQPLSVSSNGLKSNMTFAVRGLFDLSSTLSGVGMSSYQIELTDSFGGGNTGPGNGDTTRLGVQSDSQGNLNISFRATDLASNSSVHLDDVTLQSGHQQLLLELTRASTTGPVTASYAYVDSPTDIADPTALAGLNLVQLNGSADLFHGEDFTRAGFYVVERVDEPPAPGVVTFCLIGIVMVFGRRKRVGVLQGEPR